MLLQLNFGNCIPILTLDIALYISGTELHTDVKTIDVPQ